MKRAPLLSSRFVTIDTVELIGSVQEAWKSSFLGAIGIPSEQLLLDARLTTHAAYSPLLRTRSTPSISLVVDGLARVFLRSADGRQTTARYATKGEIVGLPALLVASMEIEVEALTDVTVVILNGERFSRLASCDATTAWATAKYVARQLAESNVTLGADIFQPVRARIARHLLDLADPDEPGLVVRVSHQRIADSIGSVREVVSREIRALDKVGALRRDSDVLVLSDPEHLHALALGGRVSR